MENEIEIRLCPVRDCNNRCDFCIFYNDENDAFQIPTVSQFIKNGKYTDLIRPVFERFKSYDRISVYMHGGELFFDARLKPRLFEIIDMLAQYANVTVNFTTNLMFSDLDFLFQTCDRLASLGIKHSVSTSYDFGSARFKSEGSYKTFMANVRRVLSLKSNIEIGILKTRMMHDVIVRHDWRYARQYDDLAGFIADPRILLMYTSVHGSSAFMESLSLPYEHSVDLFKSLLQMSGFELKKMPTYFSNMDTLDKIRAAYRKGIVVFGNHVCMQDKDVSFQSTPHMRYPYVTDLAEAEKSVNQHKFVGLKKYGCLECRYMKICSVRNAIETNYETCDLKEALDQLRLSGVSL